VPGRFAIFTDENVDGPLIKALSARGWDVVRAVDVFGERTDDEALFARVDSHRERSPENDPTKGRRPICALGQNNAFSWTSWQREPVRP
jgi:hypothetical protein